MFKIDKKIQRKRGFDLANTPFEFTKTEGRLVMFVCMICFVCRTQTNWWASLNEMNIRVPFFFCLSA